MLMVIRGAAPRPVVTDARPHKRVHQMREHEIDRLVLEYKKTRNMRQIAREFRVSRETVAKHLRSRGVDTSKGMKPADIAKAKELYAQGMGSGRIGRMLGFDNKTILKAVAKTRGQTGSDQ